MTDAGQVLPKYLQIAKRIRDDIARGELKPGDEVPSERALAATWQVARPTAARALESLRIDGVVESQQGSGTYVRDVRAVTRAGVRYARSRQLGRVYFPDERAEIVAAELTDAPLHVSEALTLPDGSAAIRRQRVLRSDTRGVVEVSTSWFDPGLSMIAPKLLRTTRIRAGTVAYIESTTGRHAMHAIDRTAARLATAAEREWFELGADAAAVLTHRHTLFDHEGQVIEFTEALYPPDQWTFEQRYDVT